MTQYLNFSNKRGNSSIKHSFGLVLNKIETVFFSFLCVICLIVSRANPDFSKDVSEVFVDVSLPIAKLSSFPFNATFNLLNGFYDLVAAKNENEKLKKDIEEMRSFYIQSLGIHEENKELRKMLNFISAKTANFKVVRVIGRSRPLFNQKIFIDAGSNLELKVGEVIIGKKGIIGRVVEVFDDKAQVILLNDATSRIPVIASQSRDRAILSGDGSGLMEMLYLPKSHGIKVGEMIFTSGDGDTLPPGLLAGVVRKVADESVLVEMVEDANNADLVTVVSY